MFSIFFYTSWEVYIYYIFFKLLTLLIFNVVFEIHLNFSNILYEYLKLSFISFFKSWVLKYICPIHYFIHLTAYVMIILSIISWQRLSICKKNCLYQVWTEISTLPSQMIYILTVFWGSSDVFSSETRNVQPVGTEAVYLSVETGRLASLIRRYISEDLLC